MTDKIAPILMFTGNAEEAMHFYVSLFHDSRVMHIDYRPAEPGTRVGKVKLARFVLAGRDFLCSDSPIENAFKFTPCLSLFVSCVSEAELEWSFRQLSEGGQVLMPLDKYEFGRKFGWVNDRFGVSWQINLA